MLKTKIIALSFLMALSASSVSYAGSHENKTNRDSERLENKVKIESFSHDERIAILNEANACIKNASTQSEYSTCEKKESTSREEVRKKLKEMKKADLLDKLSNRISKAEKKGNKKYVSSLTEMRKCVQASESKDGIKACFKKYGGNKKRPSKSSEYDGDKKRWKEVNGYKSN